MTTEARRSIAARSRIVAPAIAGMFLAFASTLVAHDLFLRARSYFVDPNTAVEIMVLNGTFDESEGPVARDRVRDISVVAPDGTTHPDTSAWRPQGDTTYLRLRTAEAGTYVGGDHPLGQLGSSDNGRRALKRSGTPLHGVATNREGGTSATISLRIHVATRPVDIARAKVTAWPLLRPVRVAPAYWTLHRSRSGRA